jgi:hypothetical protein
MVFVLEEQPSFSPRSTTHPPRIHHKNTTQKHPFFQDPHQKTPAKPAKTGSTGASEFFPETP